jgi:hypothetical protein
MSVSTRLAAAATAFHTLSVGGGRLGLDGWRLIA